MTAEGTNNGQAGGPRLIKGIHIDTYGSRKAKVREVFDSLYSWYSLLDCIYIDIPRVEIEGKVYDVIVDDNGLDAMEGHPLPSVYCKGEPLLFGSVFICNGNPDTGEEESLTEEDIDTIFKYIHHRRIVSDYHDTDLDLLLI